MFFTLRMKNKITEFYESVSEKMKVHGIIKFFQLSFYEFLQRPVVGLFFKTYSQKGEDVVIDRFLGYKKTGFYIDVGAYDPVRFSNTKRFYDRGWSVINIEPDYKNYQKFIKMRKRDINLNIGIGQQVADVIFHSFKAKAISTFSKDWANLHQISGYVAGERFFVKMDKLDNVLQQYLQGRHIDFLSIDTEGFDLDVLKSNDWSKFRPTLVCAECIKYNSNGKSDLSNNEIESFLEGVGYEKAYENDMNIIFKDKSLGFKNV